MKRPENLSKIEYHKWLLTRCFDEVVFQINEILYSEKTLPSRVSIPHQDPKTGDWVRIAVDLSPVRKTSEELKDYE